MQQTNLPRQIVYSNVRPQGWYTKFKQWPLQPNSSNLYWTPNQIVRFLFQLNSGVMDPYRSHIQLTVQVNQADLPVGGLVVDVSAQSFIAQHVITSNSRQVERILDYDTLSAYLHDVGFSQWVCKNRQWEGMGYDNTPTQRKVKSVNGTSTSGFYYQSPDNVAAPTGVQVVENSIGGLMSPTKTHSTNALISLVTNASTPATVSDMSEMSGTVTSHTSSTNFIQNPINYLNGSDPTLSKTGKLANIRYQYQPDVSCTQYIDSSSSLLTCNPYLVAGCIPSNWKTGAGMPSNQTYKTYYPQTVGVGRAYPNSSTTNLLTRQFFPNITSLHGYSKPYSHNFTGGMNQPLLSPTIPQCQLSYGGVMKQPVPINKKTFKIPLLSTVLGVLIPADQFVLLPLQALQNLLLQLTLSPYAMYSTGCSDVHEFDAVGMQKPIKRTYLITQIVYNVHIYDFPEAATYIKASLSRQIVITGNYWQQSAQYQLPNGQVVKNNWQINTSVISLAQVVCIFLSNHYLRYPYCRKQYRLSNNITSMQLKFNTQYHPAQPIVGNAGNPQTIDNTGDNSPFLQLILLSNNYLFSTNVPSPKINPYSFAMNSRVWDPTKTTPLYDSAMIANKTYQYTSNSVNSDTAMGQSYFHENRCRGMAAFSYSFEPYAHSKNYTVGIDTRNSRPFDILFDSSPVGFYPSDQTLYIFTRSNVSVTYSSNGINVYGR